MADSYTTTDSSGSGFVVVAGDVFEVSCDICDTFKDSKTAMGYCSECQQYLCSKCCRSHSRIRATAKHKILKGSQIPAPNSTRRPTDLFCTNHPDERLKFFCELHNTPCCSICKSRVHRQCLKVERLGDAAKGVRESAQLGLELHRLSEVLARFERLHSKRSDNFHSIERETVALLKGLSERRRSLDKALDKLEGKIRRELDRVRSKQTQIKREELVKIDSIVKLLKTKQGVLEDRYNKESNERIFVELMTVQAGMDKLEDMLEEFKSNSLQSSLQGVSVQAEVDEVVRDVCEFGSIQLLGTRSDCETFRIPKAVLSRMVNIRESSDKQVCHITSILALQDGNYLIADWNNCCLKLLDSSLRLKSKLIMPSHPFGLALVDGNQAAVTLPNVKKVQFVSTDSNIKAGRRTFNTEGHCWGVGYDGHHLIVCLQEPPQVQVLEMNGRPIRKIQHDQGGDDLFIYPHHVTVSKDRTCAFVSDWGTGLVTWIDTSGLVQESRTYEDENLREPSGITLDSEGHLLITGIGSGNVQMATSGGNYVCEVLKELKRPCSLCQSTDGRQLILSMLRNDELNVYSIEYT